VGHEHISPEQKDRASPHIPMQRQILHELQAREGIRAFNTIHGTIRRVKQKIQPHASDADCAERNRR
jgi:hypothetical protein